MLRIALRTMRPQPHPRPSFETRALRAPQDEDLFLGARFFFAARSVFFAARFSAALFFAAFEAVLRAFGRFLSAARWAAPSATLAHSLNSSGSSNSRAGSCQYEATVTDLLLVW